MHPSDMGGPTLLVTAQVFFSKPASLQVNISFEVPPGITILFGPSGSGKSTTLAAIAGLICPKIGTIKLGDEVWFDSVSGIDRPPHLRDLAYVFQSLALFPHMSARKNVEYGIDRRVPRRKRQELAEGMLEQMRVGYLADRRPATFSGGEAQRVALARAFARRPRVVLLDEAFSAMDQTLRCELSQDIRRFITTHPMPVLYVTHHRKEARRLGDRAVLIQDGKITQSGSVLALIPEPGSDEV